jgi:hypothetical protein
MFISATTSLRYYYTSLLQDGLIKEFPILRHAFSSLTHEPVTKKEPDFLESMNSLGQHISCIGLALSLWSWSLIPAGCFACFIVIFKKTVLELQKRKTTSEKLEHLSTQVSDLSSMLKASNISAEGIKAMTKQLENLKDKQAALLVDYQETLGKQAQAVELLKFTCQKFAAQGDAIHQTLSSDCKVLNTEVNRLSKVGMICNSCLKTILPS